MESYNGEEKNYLESNTTIISLSADGAADMEHSTSATFVLTTSTAGVTVIVSTCNRPLRAERPFCVAQIKTLNDNETDSSTRINKDSMKHPWDIEGKQCGGGQAREKPIKQKKD